MRGVNQTLPDQPKYNHNMAKYLLVLDTSVTYLSCTALISKPMRQNNVCQFKYIFGPSYAQLVTFIYISLLYLPRNGNLESFPV